MASHSIKPPIPLSAEALAMWADLASSTVPVAKLQALAAYCAAYGRWVTAETWLAQPEHGPVMTIRDDKGNIKSHGPSPHLAIAERSAKEMARLAPGLRAVLSKSDM